MFLSPLFLFLQEVAHFDLGGKGRCLSCRERGGGKLYDCVRRCKFFARLQDACVSRGILLWGSGLEPQYANE